MTGDATVIRIQRERAQAEQLIRYNAFNTAAIDCYNDLSRLLKMLDHRGGTR